MSSNYAFYVIDLDSMDNLPIMILLLSAFYHVIVLFAMS